MISSSKMLLACLVASTVRAAKRRWAGAYTRFDRMLNQLSPEGANYCKLASFQRKEAECIVGDIGEFLEKESDQSFLEKWTRLNSRLTNVHGTEKLRELPAYTKMVVRADKVREAAVVAARKKAARKAEEVRQDEEYADLFRFAKLFETKWKWTRCTLNVDTGAQTFKKGDDPEGEWELDKKFDCLIKGDRLLVLTDQEGNVITAGNYYAKVELLALPAPPTPEGSASCSSDSGSKFGYLKVAHLKIGDW